MKLNPSTKSETTNKSVEAMMTRLKRLQRRRDAANVPNIHNAMVCRYQYVPDGLHATYDRMESTPGSTRLLVGR